MTEEPCEEPQIDLTLVSTEKLWEELSSRYDGCIFAFEGATRTGDDKSAANTVWRGGCIRALGLTVLARKDLLKQFREAEQVHKQCDGEL
jgi:hypothetical protein